MFLLILSPHSLGDSCDQFCQFTSIRTTSVEVKLCLCVCVCVCLSVRLSVCLCVLVFVVVVVNVGCTFLVSH